MKAENLMNPNMQRTATEVEIASQKLYMTKPGTKQYQKLQQILNTGELRAVDVPADTVAQATHTTICSPEKAVHSPLRTSILPMKREIVSKVCERMELIKSGAVDYTSGKPTTKEAARRDKCFVQTGEQKEFVDE